MFFRGVGLPPTSYYVHLAVPFCRQVVQLLLASRCWWSHGIPRYGGFFYWKVSQNGRSILEILLKWMIWGYPYFRKLRFGMIIIQCWTSVHNFSIDQYTGWQQGLLKASNWCMLTWKRECDGKMVAIGYVGWLGQIPGTYITKMGIQSSETRGASPVNCVYRWDIRTWIIEWNE